MKKAKKYRCLVCNHIYDPVQGDPEAGIAAGTQFEDIAEDWICPECGATKADFEPMDD
jgi:rubredoxin